ncbi:hypothetical protein EDC30_10969 [Paucimonas lemoignei]|uniref:Uncharacterized protein n=1 Tax=Paucimonas lemoignei TaxID=29443 RepID=A0A4V6NXY0_PAULE|nr:hypothetical protein EDC30_10969 [Paucimonas lemoignei]
MPTSHSRSTPSSPGKQKVQTEADAQSMNLSGKPAQTRKSSHDQKSHNKAGSNEGAGGGKKQERDH